MEDITHPFRAQACEPPGSGSNMPEALPWRKPLHKAKWRPHRSRGLYAEFICEILWPVINKKSEKDIRKSPFWLGNVAASWSMYSQMSWMPANSQTQAPHDLEVSEQTLHAPRCHHNHNYSRKTGCNLPHQPHKQQQIKPLVIKDQWHVKPQGTHMQLANVFKASHKPTSCCLTPLFTSSHSLYEPRGLWEGYLRSSTWQSTFPTPRTGPKPTDMSHNQWEFSCLFQ